MYFSIVATQTRAHLPVVVKHYASADEDTAKSPLSFLVQWLDIFKARSDTCVTVLENSDAEWVTYDALGAFLFMYI